MAVLALRKPRRQTERGQLVRESPRQAGKLADKLSALRSFRPLRRDRNQTNLVCQSRLARVEGAKFCRADQLRRGDVAQIFNLLYRRIAFGWTPLTTDAAETADARRIENPRYSRFGNLRYVNFAGHF